MKVSGLFLIQDFEADFLKMQNSADNCSFSDLVSVYLKAGFYRTQYPASYTHKSLAVARGTDPYP